MNKVNSEKILKILRGARKEFRSWTDIAWALRELEGIGPADENGRPWIQRAEEESGYSVNQLRRMVKVAAYQTYLTEAHPELLRKLTGRPFSHVEMLSKIWSLDEKKARELINASPSDQTFRELLAIYGRINEQHGTAPIAVGKKAARQFRERTLALIKRNPKQLFETDKGLSFEILRPIVPFRYASPDFYVVGRDEGKVAQIDAIDFCALHGGSQKDAAFRKMILVATESSFFTRFWIVVPAGESASTILWECKDLRLDNVGVVVVGVNDRLHWERIPLKEAEPNPDRRHLWTDYDKSRLRRDRAQS